MLSPTVLHIIPKLLTGGAEVMLVRLLSAFKKQPAFQHVVLTLGVGNDFCGELDEMGISVHSLRIRSRAALPWHFFQLRRIVDNLQPDVIHAWMYHANMAAYHAGAGCPVIFSVHNALDALCHEKWTTRMVLKHGARLSQHASAVVYCSEKGRKQHEQIGYDAARSVFIPNGVDINMFQPDPGARKIFRDMLGVKNHTTLFGQIARFHPIKNQTGMIKAFSVLAGKSAATELILAGEGCDQNNKVLVALIDSHGVSNRVHLLGVRSDVEKILPGLDVLVSPSLSEAFPVAIAEAMACGLPCIATDVGDTAALLADTGVVVASNNNEALAHAMQEMLCMSETRLNDLGMKARSRIHRKYSMEVVASSYQTLYFSLIKHSVLPCNVLC